MKKILILDLRKSERSSSSSHLINKGEKLLYQGVNLPNITQVVSSKAGVRTTSRPQCQDPILSRRSEAPLVYIGSKSTQGMSS